jgi:hypothetical protein
VPPLLIALGVFGVLAVIAGNALAVSSRRRAPIAWAFQDAPTRTDVAPAPALVGHDAFRVDAAPAPPAPRPRSGRGGPPASSWVLYAVCFGTYVVLGGLLVLRYGSIYGDAQARVADAWYVLFSRDPHLAAVGFVWAPLPSLLVLPLLVFKPIWPALSELSFAGNVASAAFMAGCVVQLRGTLRELGARPALTWVLVALFALNPMVVYYGANGMSEAFQLLFLLLAVRTLLRWIRTGSLTQLVWSGSAMGLAYLTRYEAAAAAGGAIAVVAIVSFSRTVGTRKARVNTAAGDAVLYGLPFFAAFIGWAVVSYVITGSAFEYSSSQYGNSSQLAIIGHQFTEHALGMPLPAFAGLQLLAFAPLLPILVVATALVGWQRRDLEVLGVMVPLTSILGFVYLLFVSGNSFSHLRPFLPALPLAALCVAYLLTPRRRRGRAPGQPRRTPARTKALVAALVAGAVMAPSIGATAWAMQDPKLGADERLFLWWVISGRTENADQQAKKALVPSARHISDTIDAMQLPDGSIVVDTFTSCVSMIVMMSDHPHQYVITSDRDYQRVLADPTTFHAHYLLVPPSAQYGTLDAVNREYPGLYRDGAGFAHKVKDFHERGCPPFRLYRVTQSPRLHG